MMHLTSTGNVRAGSTSNNVVYPPLEENGWKLIVAIDWDSDHQVRDRVALIQKGCGCKTLPDISLQM